MDTTVMCVYVCVCVCHAARMGTAEASAGNSSTAIVALQLQQADWTPMPVDNTLLAKIEQAKRVSTHPHMGTRPHMHMHMQHSVQRNMQTHA